MGGSKKVAWMYIACFLADGLGFSWNREGRCWSILGKSRIWDNPDLARSYLWFVKSPRLTLGVANSVRRTAGVCSFYG